MMFILSHHSNENDLFFVFLQHLTETTEQTELHQEFNAVLISGYGMQRLPKLYIKQSNCKLFIFTFMLLDNTCPKYIQAVHLII